MVLLLKKQAKLTTLCDLYARNDNIAASLWTRYDTSKCQMLRRDSFFTFF